MVRCVMKSEDFSSHQHRWRAIRLLCNHTLANKFPKSLVATVIVGLSLIAANSHAGISTWGGKCGVYNFSLSYGLDTDGAWTDATFSINGKPYWGSVLNSELGTTTFRSKDKQVYYYASGREHALTFKGTKFMCVDSF